MERSSSHFIYIFGFLIVLTTGQITQPGKCPEVTVQQDFKIDDYMGVWYGYERYPAKFEEDGKCTYARYEKLSNGSVLVINTQTKIATGETTFTKGIANLIESGKFSVDFKGSKGLPGANYLILGTNYKDYSIVYYCREIPEDQNKQLLWIITRERNPNAESLADAYRILDQNKLSKSHLIKADQTDCPALTETDQLIEKVFSS